MSAKIAATSISEGRIKPSPLRRVCLCEQNVALLETVRQVLAADPALRIVAESATAAACLNDVRNLRPDVAVLDVRMPDMSGLELAGELRRATPNTKVVVLVTEDTRGYHDAAARHGAICVAKDRLVERLSAAIASSSDALVSAVDAPLNSITGGASMSTYLDSRTLQAEVEPHRQSALRFVRWVGCFRSALAVFLIGTLLLVGAVWVSEQAQAYTIQASIVATSDGGGYVVDETGRFGSPGRLTLLSAGQRQAYVKEVVSKHRSNLAAGAGIAFAGLVISALLIGCFEVRDKAGGKPAV